MDSGNSGSMQSSSGGDEEYDSRTESISPFLNHSFGSISNHPQPPPSQPPPPLFHHQQSTLFDSQAHNLGPFSHSSPNPNPNPNNLYNNNLDFVWPRSGLRSESNYAELGNLLSSSSSSSLSSSSQSLLGLHQGPTTQVQFPSSSSSMPLPSSLDHHGNGGGGGGRGGGGIGVATTTPRSDQTNQGIKSSRKRTRASRRAPTTVLTTDTSNFRQMVQEFTGIPAPPFSATSPYSRRFDLFGGGGGSAMSLYPFRPSAQKVVPQSPFVPSSSSSPSFLNSTMNIDPTSNLANSTANNNITSSIAGPSSSYQQQQQLPQQGQNQTMLNMQNPILTFQSLLQSPAFGSKSEARSAIPSLDELGMSHHEHVSANLGGFQSHGSNNNHLSRWRGEEASTDVGHQEHLGSFDGNDGGGGGGDSQNVSNYKLNCLAPSSDFHPET
ncbi:uncharacterized protein LOC114315499 [Camellia sinensis]|uniref:VQ domain-containing protein n=1 Tax=Camellia sinensis var. sinensis TaxID=542762 RepID=A0A4S4D5E3_CAMSN|nr:uncharacterized protein LOC114315499 [Camellia sinensis]THF97584.1 hypothetical protein TEA_007586 [Camellia sinensis var. sinensis]